MRLMCALSLQLRICSETLACQMGYMTITYSRELSTTETRAPLLESMEWYTPERLCALISLLLHALVAPRVRVLAMGARDLEGARRQPPVNLVLQERVSRRHHVTLRRHDCLTTTTSAALATARCWSCLSARGRADSLHGHVYDESELCPYAYEPGLIARLLGAVLDRGRTRLRR